MTIERSQPMVRDLEPVFHASLTVLPSPIHGQGVFTRSTLAPGEVLIRLGGFLLTHDKRYARDVLPSTSVGLAEEVILAEVRGSERDISDVLNHCCIPNTGFTDAVTIVAARMISAEEELTIDYAYWEADENWRLKNPCMCASKHCRRAVSGSDWRNPAITSRLLRWASPFVRRRIYNYL